MSELARDLDSLQFRQEVHDRLFHADIYTLSKPRRLAHLVLHHCKYVSKIYALTREPSDLEAADAISKLSVDGFIICMSIANVCNVKLLDHIRVPKPMDPVGDLLREMGRMAKTVEDIDHMAQTNPLGEVLKSAAVMASAYSALYFRSTLTVPANNVFALFVASLQRLQQVESKHIFHKRLHHEVARLMKDSAVWI